MKRLAIFLMCFLWIQAAVGQSTEGHVKYNIEIIGEGPNAEFMRQVMKGSFLEVYFTADETHTISVVGENTHVSYTTNTQNGEILMLSTVNDRKTAVKTTSDSIEIFMANHDDMGTVEYVKGKKKIQGYKCKKAIYTGVDGSKITYWYTEKFDVHPDASANFNGHTPGLIMECEMNTYGITLLYTVELIEDEIKDDAIFNMDIPQGFNQMSWLDYEKLNAAQQQRGN